MTLHVNQSPSESLQHGESLLTSHSEGFYREVFHNWLFPWGGTRRKKVSRKQPAVKQGRVGSKGLGNLSNACTAFGFGASLGFVLLGLC